MSFFTRISTIGAYINAFLTSNQQPPAQPAVATDVARNALQAPVSTVNTPITGSLIPDPETASNIQTVAQDVLPLARRPLQDVLNEWADNDLRKITAATKISTCVRERDSTLDLSFIQLTSLPDIFSYPELQHLQELDLRFNQLTELTASIGQLTNLQRLDLSRNQLTELTASIGQLTNLQRLDLSRNRLAALPECIGGLTALQTLYLNSNQLTELSASIGGLTALQTLYLNSNQLTALPDSLSQLTNLQELDLRFNQLTELPASIGGLTALQTLCLNSNRLTALPDSLSQLTNLRELDLGFNQLTELPASIGGLTALRTLYLDGNPLIALPNFLRALPNLDVHDLPFAVNIESITEEICSLAQVEPSEALNQLYANATDGDDGQKALLRAWVSRLKDTAPGKAKDVNFYKSIVTILELASSNASFAETFWIVIADAATTCGDRMALSILDLDIARQLMTLDLEKHLQVADFLKRGVWTYNLLKEIAVDKALTLRAEGTHFDEIEVHLGYFIKLKEALNLPITMQDMLYFRCSTLTEDDLAAAKNHILGQVSNEEAFVNFLIEQDKWKETLKIKCPAKLDAIEESYAESEQDPDVALETYQTGLKELTKQLLQEPETKPITRAKRPRIGAGEPPALEDRSEDEHDDEDRRRKIVTPRL